jgi:hypothetical protein
VRRLGTREADGRQCRRLALRTEHTAALRRRVRARRSLQTAGGRRFLGHAAEPGRAVQVDRIKPVFKAPVVSALEATM